MDSPHVYTTFRPVIYDRWVPDGLKHLEADPSRIHVAVTSPSSNAAPTLFELVEGLRVISLGVEAASAAGVSDGHTIPEQHLDAALDAAGLAPCEEGFLSYLPRIRHVAEARNFPNVRRLTSSDGDAFAGFMEQISQAEKQEAAVSMDDWLVYGTFLGTTLVAAASAYTEYEGKFADVGVVTAPAFRGSGHGRSAIIALTNDILGSGLEPQYRSDATNPASHRLAASAGYRQFLFWRTFSQARRFHSGPAPGRILQ